MALVNRIKRKRKSPQGWNIIRTRVIADLLGTMESVLVQNTRYDIRSTIAIGGYSIVYRNMANKNDQKYSLILI